MYVGFILSTRTITVALFLNLTRTVVPKTDQK